MFRTMQKLLKKEEIEEVKLPRMRRKISHEMHVCGGCGHLYFYRVVRCPLCESRNIKVVNKDVVGKMVRVR